MHYTTVVAAMMNPPMPMLVFGPETELEISQLPLVTSVHRIRNEIMPYIHASGLMALPVSDQWVQAVAGYDNDVKVVLLEEPLPAGFSTAGTPIEQGASGDQLPGWLLDVIGGRVRLSMRDVHVSEGENPLSIMISMEQPTSLAAWAHQRIDSTMVADLERQGTITAAESDVVHVGTADDLLDLAAGLAPTMATEEDMIRKAALSPQVIGFLRRRNGEAATLREIAEGAGIAPVDAVPLMLNLEMQVEIGYAVNGVNQAGERTWAVARIS